MSRKGLTQMLDDLSDKEEQEEKLNRDNKRLINKHLLKTQQARTKQRHQSAPWPEKYRPTLIDDVLVDNATKQRLKQIIKSKNMPNLIITGVPGIGKTTTTNCLANALLGPYRKDCVLDINASDDRGVKAIKHKIINFCKRRVATLDAPAGKYALHKIAHFDEADNMVKNAQQLISTVMDTYNDTTRFTFTCNSSEGIIEAIQTRCSILRFRRMNTEDMIKRLEYICKEEDVTYTKEGLDALVITSQGDMRKAVNSLELTHTGIGDVTAENVYKVCDVPHPLVIKGLFKACVNKDLKAALISLNALKHEGYCNSDLCCSMFETLKTSVVDDIMEEKARIRFLREISDTSVKISQNVNSDLQMSGCVARLCGI